MKRRFTEKVLFLCKLEGWDRNWQEVGTRRQANYNNLPPRNYRFRVIASNKCGVWEQTQIARDLQDTLLQICARYEEHA